MPRRRLAAAFALTLTVGLAAGFFLPDDDYFALRKNFTIFGRLYEELAAGYVDEVDPEHLMRTGIAAMLGTLDPYTVFLDEADNEDMDIVTRGRYGGVGLSLDERGGRIVVLGVLEGYSGFEQGVRVGDQIVSIDGQEASALTSSDIRSLLRGAPGTTVTIEVEREGEPGRLRFVLTRSQVQLKNVTYTGYVGDPAAGVGYVRLERFTQGAGQEVHEAVERLRGEGTLRALVLDLRGNGGGLLEEAVRVSSVFLPARTPVVSMRGRAEGTERSWMTEENPAAADLPLAVLTDGASASASEIVAGALQDHDRAILVGEATYGKGLVQVVRPLPYNTSLKITTARYYTPLGRSIQAFTYDGPEGRAAIPDSARHAFRTRAGREVFDGHGVEPDVPVSLGPVSDIEEALVRDAAFFRFANRYAATHPALPPHFAVDDALLEEFAAFVDREVGEVPTRAERALDALADDLGAAGYAATGDEVEALRREIEEEKENDFSRHAARLKARLRQEILSRYGGRTDQIRAALEDDPPLVEALRLLGDEAAYRRVLGG